MKSVYISVFLYSLLYCNFVLAVNVQQFSRSNSLTFEMIEDARLSNSHVLNQYKWLFNLGVSYVDEPLVIKNSQNTDQLDSVIDSMQSIHLGVAYYIKPYWQIAANTSFSYFEDNSNNGIKGFQDLDLRSKIRLYNDRRNAFTIMPVLSIPFKGGRTLVHDNASPALNYGYDNLLSDNGLAPGLFLIYEHLFRSFQVSFNLGYKWNEKNKFIDDFGTTQIDKTQVLTAGIGAYFPIHEKVGLNVEIISNFTAPFFNKDLNPNEAFVGLSSGLSNNIHGFFGAGFGNLLSGSDGNDYRLVAGIKFTPDSLSFEKNKNYKLSKLKPNRIVEDHESFCKKSFLFGESNAVTILFEHDSDQVSTDKKNKLKKILKVINDRIIDVESIEIFGHTSSLGAVNYNQDLSEQRARTIKKLLIESGISSGLISQIIPKGEKDTLQKGNSTKDHKVNRRSEINITLNERFRSCYE